MHKNDITVPTLLSAWVCCLFYCALGFPRTFKNVE